MKNIILKGAGQRKLRFAGHHLKGAGFAWIFGLMMVLIVVAVFATGVTSHYDAQTTIVSRSVVAYDTMHTSEYVKRTIDGAAFAAAQVSIEELASNGGGFATWKTGGPTQQELNAKLAESIGQKMNMLIFDGFNGREIYWQDANVQVVRPGDYEITLSGAKPFTVDNKVTTPKMTIDSKGGFETTVKSNYYALLKAGKSSTDCKKLETGTGNFVGFSRTITAVNSNYLIKLKDANGLELVFTLECENIPEAG